MRIGAGYSYGWTTLYFFGSGNYNIARHGASATLEWRTNERMTLTASAGALFGGTMTQVVNSGPAASYRLDPGWLLAASVTWRLLDGSGNLPFLLAGFSVGGSAVRTTQLNAQGAATGASVPFLGLDFRGSLIAGKTLLGAFTPYLVARLFGGPVVWRDQGEDRFGTDIFHYQVGLGAVLSIARRVDLGVEFVGLGERSLAAQLSFAP